jgi:methylenetetrahydrofolate reductase (NADPH)
MLDRVDRALFEDHSLGATILGPAFLMLDKSSLGKQALLSLEHMIKKPILGCETCGFCRIPYLEYICPETCPKGLANGPCSGTDDNVCEFKDRECIHNRKYRIAKSNGRLSDLETVIVPAVTGTRMTSSWVNQYRHSNPPVVRISKLKQTSSEDPPKTNIKTAEANLSRATSVRQRS